MPLSCNVMIIAYTVPLNLNIYKDKMIYVEVTAHQHSDIFILMSKT